MRYKTLFIIEFTLFTSAMAVVGVRHVVCCIHADTVDVLRYLDNFQFLDTDRRTFREMVAVQPLSAFPCTSSTELCTIAAA
ncbi:MAG: hypothetical protein OXI24_03845, partial [Candidatus Poribacteria bacterium]|nr:hypothetical protein [Candidatus Poribacteria bacterium]